MEWRRRRPSSRNTKKAVIANALQRLITRRRQRRLLDLIGKLEWDDRFDFKAERSRG